VPVKKVLELLEEQKNLLWTFPTSIYAWPAVEFDTGAFGTTPNFTS
jgi:hypothetical protein